MTYLVDLCEGAEFERLREEWNDLLRQCRLPTPFMTWEWIDTWRRSVASDARLFVVRVRDGGRTCALLPLTCRGAARAWQALDFAGVEGLGADHLDLIAGPAEANASLLAIARYMQDNAVPWRELRLPLLAEDSDLLHFARQHNKSRTAIRRASRAPYIAIDGDYDRFLSGLSSNERYKLRQRSRRLIDRGGARYCTYGAEQATVALGALFELHRQRAAEKNMRSTFASESVARFHEALVGILPPEQVVLRGLEIEGRPIAMFYGFRYADRLFYFQLGYDPAWSEFSPGIVMLTKTVQEACETGCAEYNFLQGDEPFKYIWTKKARDLYDCTVYNNSILGAAYCGARRLVDSVKQALRPVHAPAKGNGATVIAGGTGALDSSADGD